MKFHVHIGGGGPHGRPPRHRGHRHDIHHDSMRRRRVHHVRPGVHVHTSVGTSSPIAVVIFLIIIAVFMGIVFFGMF